jgi:hypothetical protein
MPADLTKSTASTPRSAITRLIAHMQRQAALEHALVPFDGWSGDTVIPDDAELEPVKRTRQRKPTVASVIRQMQRAGVEVAGCKINPRDGTVVVITKPGEAAMLDSDEWAGVLLQ